jgi:hypothetical protein
MKYMRALLPKFEGAAADRQLPKSDRLSEQSCLVLTERLAPVARPGAQDLNPACSRALNGSIVFEIFL